MEHDYGIDKKPP